MPNEFLWKSMLAAHPAPDDIDALLPTLFEQRGREWLASPKYDGVRVSVQNGKLYTRSLKLVPNREMQALWGRPELDGLDAEVIVGDPTAPNCFNRTSGAVRSANKSANGAKLYAFDHYSGDEPYAIRLANVGVVIDGSCGGDRFTSTIKHVRHKRIKTLAQAQACEQSCLDAGHEGFMLRDAVGGYKQGRSTLIEGGLIAFKRTVDAEAVVLATYEQEENTNEKTVNELGRSKRTTHKAGKVAKGTLGGFTVAMLTKDFKPTIAQVRMVVAMGEMNSCVFNIGTGVGLTTEYRQELWKHRDVLVGQIVKFRYQKIGTMEKPRQPIFLGFRDPRDM